MAFTIKHSMVSGKSDGIDTSLVQPSDWNDEHAIIMDAYTIVGRGSGGGAASGIAMGVIGLPIGGLLPFAGAAAPSTFLLCYGQAVSRATYADLFTALGTTYGAGDGSTTFNVPDLRGRAVFGVGNMGGVESGRLNSIVASALAATGGAQTEQVGVSVSGTVTVGGSASGTLTGYTGVSTGDTRGMQPGGDQADGPTHYHPNVTVSGTLTVFANGGTTLTGATALATNVPPAIELNYIVKALYV